MDGICAVYSMMMNLITLKVFTRNQVTNSNTSFKGCTIKVRPFKEFFVTERLCRDGFYFSEIKEKLSHSFVKNVASSANKYSILISDQALYVEELKTSIDDNLSFVTAISFSGGAHAILLLGMKNKKE